MKKTFELEIEVDELFKDLDNTIEMRAIQLVIYENKILTLDEYLRRIMTKTTDELMDKKIKSIKKKIKKDSASEEKELGELQKMDKKRDKACDVGEKLMKKKKK